MNPDFFKKIIGSYIGSNTVDNPDEFKTYIGDPIDNDPNIWKKQDDWGTGSWKELEKVWKPDLSEINRLNEDLKRLQAENEKLQREAMKKAAIEEEEKRVLLRKKIKETLIKNGENPTDAEVEEYVKLVEEK